MGERLTKEIPAKAPKRRRKAAPKAKAGLPAQQDVDVWPILAEPDTAVDEVASGAHDVHLVLLESVARSQGIASVSDACRARRKALGA